MARHKARPSADDRTPVDNILAAIEGLKKRNDQELLAVELFSPSRVALAPFRDAARILAESLIRYDYKLVRRGRSGRPRKEADRNRRWWFQHQRRMTIKQIAERHFGAEYMAAPSLCEDQVKKGIRRHEEDIALKPHRQGKKLVPGRVRIVAAKPAD